jgi:hypothetical protein
MREGARDVVPAHIPAAGTARVGAHMSWLDS